MTVLASQPSVSIETETTQRTCSPRRSFLPMVFMTSRRRSSSVMSSTERPGKRRMYSRLNSSISAAAIFLNAGSIASPDSIWAESIRRVFGRSIQAPSSTLLKIRRLPRARRRGVVLAGPPAGDPVEHDLADVRVLADDDEDRRRARRRPPSTPGSSSRSCRRGCAERGFERGVQLGLAFDLRRLPGPCEAPTRGCAPRGRGTSAGRRPSSRRRPGRVGSSRSRIRWRRSG